MGGGGRASSPHLIGASKMRRYTSSIDLWSISIAWSEKRG